MQRSDGTYDLPEASKATPVWQEEGGEVVTRIVHQFGEPTWRDGTVEVKPKPGRWLPWTPPVFPVRRKCSSRLCWITVAGKRKLASFTDSDYPFRISVGGGCCEYYQADRVTDIQWLTPEFEDELTEAQP